MLDGLLFFAACLGVGLILHWMLRNDEVAPTENTTGLFAMRTTPSQRSGKRDVRPPWRRSAGRQGSVARERPTS